MNSFDKLDLHPQLLTAISELGYEIPTPIQAQSIPILLAGRDLLAKAQTGTGKTAAFALPILSKLDLKQRAPQALVLTPTRELALQVAEAFQSYAKYFKDFHVLPIYGGQNYSAQLKALKRGVHVVVGTPGRVMDHLRRGSLNLDEINQLVLDEADEMLNMGFLEDVKWIMEQIPQTHQRSLFSATIPKSISAIVKEYLKNPERIEIQPHKTNAVKIHQSFIVVANSHKLEALTRYLEVEDFDGIIIFTRTKLETSTLAEKLEARGFLVAALNGDMQQKQREMVIERLKKGTVDIITATDVAARGLDIDRISHVINYDVPYDAESYVHRIGRTGRAGREGKALLFVTPREQRILSFIQRGTSQKLIEIKAPSIKEVTQKRHENFAKEVIATIEKTDIDLDYYRELVSSMSFREYDKLDIAAALAYLHTQGKFSLKDNAPEDKPTVTRNYEEPLESGMTRCRLMLGKKHGLKPGEIVGLIANKAGISHKEIGAIKFYEDYSFIDLKNKVVDKVIKTTKGIKLRKGVFKLTVEKAK